MSRESFEAWLSEYTLPYAATNAGGKRLSMVIAFETNGDEGAETIFKVVHGEKLVYHGGNLIEAVNRFNAAKDGVDAEVQQVEVDAGESRWEEACNARSWDEDTQILHLEGFVRQKGAGSFASKSDAVRSAWADAMQQTMAIAKVTAHEFDAMRVEDQTDLVENTLSGG